MKFPHKRKVQHTHSAILLLLFRSWLTAPLALALAPGTALAVAVALPRQMSWHVTSAWAARFPTLLSRARPPCPVLCSPPSRLHVIALFTRYATLRHTLRRGADLCRLRVIVITHTHAEVYSTDKGPETSAAAGRRDWGEGSLQRIYGYY